jgi:tRNA (cmo5U34)-methyltransferase
MDIPTEWTFETSDIAKSFDRHVREQLPWYELVTGAIAHIGRHYIPRYGLVYDIGAATGNIGRALAPTLTQRQATLVAIENSREMAQLYRGPGEIVVEDAVRFEYKPFDLAICFLVLMFLSVRERATLLDELRRQVRPGGAIIVFDKVEAASGYRATILWRLALAGKVAQGAAPADIIAKELSLGGVQRPLADHELGSDALEWFRFGDFVGWLIDA